ncbi:hypothetical protein KIN20_008093, partial [Parelaphostrongylus tenuis]
IVEGKVNKFPPNTPEFIVQFVNEKLWCKDPDKRPNFASIKEQLETLANLDADKREGVDEQKAGDVTIAASDAMTISLAGTVEIDLHETTVMKKAKKTEADITQSSAEDVEASTKTTKPQKTAKKTTIEVSVCKDPSPSEQTRNKVDRPMIEAKPAAGKPPQLEIDSRREKDEVNVETRQKPVFGRRSIFKRHWKK